MKTTDGLSKGVEHHVRKSLEPYNDHGKRLTTATVRNATKRAAERTRIASVGAAALAREATSGAVQAVGELGGETKEFIRDSVIGALEGVGQLVKITSPAVKETVVGAIRGSKQVTGDLGKAGKQSVEGAIVGAASTGIDPAKASVAAVEGAVEAMKEAGGDIADTTKAAVGGVVSGVAKTGGDTATAAREAVEFLIDRAADEVLSASKISEVAEQAVDAALEEVAETTADGEEIIAASAAGAVEAAYRIDSFHGDRVRQSVLDRILDAGRHAAPELKRHYSELSERLSEELPKGRAAWRWMAMIRAGHILIRVGGLDLAGSLAYFTIMSLLPLAALVLSAAALFGDSTVISNQITELLVYYFPASSELVRQAVQNLTSESLIIGAIALIGLAMSANGLFLAANRSLHRVFEIQTRGAIRLTLAEIGLATIIASLFLVSLGLTALHQVILVFGEDIIPTSGAMAIIATVTLTILATVLPAAFTASMFANVYYRLPNVRVRWRNALFGAAVTIVVFEIAKHLFFWFTNLTSQRNAVYGPIASIVVMMTWAYIAGLIFLYGAALTRAAGDLRPSAHNQPSTHEE